MVPAAMVPAAMVPAAAGLGAVAAAAYAGGVSTPFDQSRYQIRFEWGVDGLDRLAASDIVVVVDVLRFSSTVTDRVAEGETVPLDAAAHAVSLNGARVAAHAAAAAHSPVVLLGCLRNAAAVAREVLAEQTRRAARTSVAVIAAGELTGREPAHRCASRSRICSARVPSSTRSARWGWTTRRPRRRPRARRTAAWRARPGTC